MIQVAQVARRQVGTMERARGGICGGREVRRAAAVRR